MTQSAPLSFASIDGFEVSETIAAALASDKISVPTGIQVQSIAPILAGSNVIIESGTGTGKTLAYLLPILQKLKHDPTVRALCIAPATELAIQTLRVAERYKDPTIKAASLVSTANQRHQSSRLEKSTRFVAGTPPRILEAYERRKLKGYNLVVLDEPEPILAGRDADFLIEVLSRPEPRLQFVIVGATFGRNTQQFIQELMGSSVVHAQADDNPLRDQIRHQVVNVRNEGEKDFVLSRFATKLQGQRTIVFVNHPNLISHLYRYLTQLGFSVDTVSHERTKLQCAQAVRNFANGKFQFLLTTDQAATGLDVPDIAWVLHFELPSSAKAYLHRAGRTGRAGKTGTSVVFVTRTEQILLRRLEKELSFEFQVK